VHVLNADGATVFGFNTKLSGAETDRIARGCQVRIAGKIENPLVPGRYFVNCFVYREGSQRGALQAMHLPGFMVFGTAPGPGLVTVRTSVEATAEPEATHD
jgi:hypothetical protein